METFTIFLSSWLLPTTLVLVLSIFLYTLKSNKSSIYKLPPSPPKLPIIGNLHQLLGGKSRHQALWELSQKYGPVMLIYFGSKPFIVISSSAMAKQVLKTQDHICCSRTVFQATKRLTYNYSDAAFSPYSDHSREMRKILMSELLGPKRAKLFNRVLVTEIETMLGSLSSNTEVNLNKVFAEIVKGMICKVAFGNVYREEPLEGLSLDELLAETLEFFNVSFGDSFPWLGKIIDKFSGWEGRLEKCFNNLDAYIDAIFDQYENVTTTPDISDDEKDFVRTILDLSLQGSANSNYQLTKQDMKALVMDALAGGIDSTVVAMVWAMSEIVKNGRVMQKLQNEIRSCTGRIEKVKEMDITKMRYLKMVVKETLRLHPPAPLLVPHESISHCKIGGYDVFPKTTILINGWGIGRDPKTWGENADEFYPERFDDDENNAEVNFDLIPFGGGRRSCPAIKTAPTTVELVIANLLYWFDWEVPKGNDESLNLEEKSSLVVHKKFPLCLVPTKHNWGDY